MIDFETPRVEEGDAERKNPVPVKFIALILAAAVLAATVWILWYFLSPSRTVRLAEGTSYDYAGYAIKLEKLTNRYCPGAADVDCPHWLNEDGAQISYSGPGKMGVSFDYLGQESKPTLELPGLKIELRAVEFEKNAAKLKLSKQ